MNTLLICLLIAVLLPYLAKVPVMKEMNKEGKGYDNRHPRLQQARLQGYGARAVAAHQNAFESLAVFATAALSALATNHLSSTIQWLAIVYVVTRLVYHCLYLLDLATLRSTIWATGYLCCVAMIVLCLL
jgi:uncharacterized MAPEG superfamily protein